MTPELLIAIGGTFLAVAVISGSALSALLVRQSATRRRLQELTDPSAAARPSVVLPVQLTDAPDPALERAAKLVPKSPKEMTLLQRRMARAGYHGFRPALIFSALEIAIPLTLAAIPLLSLGVQRGWIAAAFLAFAGYMLPGFVLSWQIEKRKRLIGNGLPDALDLLIVCVEAGLGLDQAIQKASDELDIAHPALTQELRLVTTEVRAGKPRMDAFRNFAERTKVDDVRQLVSMLVQTDRFGTSIAQALRTHAETARTKRRQRAEEAAAKLGVKLVFPLVFCLFPALYVVVLGPAVIQIIHVLFEK